MAYINMQARSSSLYTGSSIYAQRQSLKFKDTDTEKRMQSDFQRMMRKAYSNPLTCLVFLALYCSTAKLEVWTLTTGGCIAAALHISPPHSGLLRRVLQQPAVLIWELGMLQSGSVCEMIGILLPSFLLSKAYSDRSSLPNWLECGVAIGLDTLVLSLFRPKVLGSGVLAALVWTYIECLLERDSRDLWCLYDSFKKSDLLKSQVLRNISVPVCVMSKDVDILFTNPSAQILFRKINGGKAEGKGLFSLVDSSFHSRLKSIVEEVSQEQKFIKYECWSNNSPSRQLGTLIPKIALELTFSPQHWVGGEAVLVLCKNKTEANGSRQIVVKLVEKILPSVKFLSQEFMRKLKYHDNIRKDDLLRLHRLHMDLEGLHLVSSFFTNKFESRTSNFNPLSEVKNFIEFASFKTFRKEVNISLVVGSISPIVSGDRTTYSLLFDSLINLAADHATPSTSIEVKLSSSKKSGTRFEIVHDLCFESSSLSKEEIDRVFGVSNEQLSVENLKEAIENYEPYGAVLKILRWLIPPPNKLQIASAKAGWITMSYSVSVGNIIDNVITRDVKMSESSVVISRDQICWNAPVSDLSPIKLQPISPSRDGSTQLKNQIKEVKRVHKAKSLTSLEYKKSQSVGEQESA
jgi:hypothetical protein